MQGKDMLDTKADSAMYVGLDVCKAWIDVYVHPCGQSYRVANSKPGLKRLRQKLKGLRVALVVAEATGKFHQLAQRSLHAAGFAVAIVNPLRARLFAEAKGELAKTDKIDARMLAIMGECFKPAARPPAPESVAELQELVRARRTATTQKTAIENQFGATEGKVLAKHLASLLRAIETHIERLDAEIAARIAADPALQRRFDIVTSIPGIGQVTGMTLVACLTELGALSAKAITMLVGLAPVASDSGATSGYREIRAGREHVRSPLYLAALSAARYNPGMKTFYKRLTTEKGKCAKKALTAVARKLVVLANTLVHENRLWTAEKP